jgi:uncharacterized protein (DUF488 family)
VTVYTIGFTKKKAQQFFELLRASSTRCVLDVRLNNVSQLAGSAKRDDLKFFLRALGDIDYLHVPRLAPTPEMLDDYKKGGRDWDLYERRFLDLMESRSIEDEFSRDLVEDSCLLCSEDKPHHCHRRLVAEYLRDRWGGALSIEHLV